MRILISGAAGFIGSHLADHLVSSGHDVIGVDDLSTGSMQNLAHLKGNPQFTFIQHDITRPMKQARAIDQIYHLATPASPQAYTARRVATITVNSVGTISLLELALEKNARFLLASSSGIYGDLAISPQREDNFGNCNPVGLRSQYDEGKRFSEACTMAYHRERQADTRIVRIFNTYGPRMSVGEGRVITNFIRQALRNELLTVYGDGTQTRSLCFVSDMVEGIVAAMASDFHEPVNLGTSEEVTIVHLAKEVLALVPGTKSKVSFEQSLAYDPRVRRPDITRAKQILEWSPKVTLREGLQKVLEWFKTESRE